MSLDTQTARDTIATAQPARKYSFSRKRVNAFDMWQEHIRKSAASVGVTFPKWHDRDLPRMIIPG